MSDWQIIGPCSRHTVVPEPLCIPGPYDGDGVLKQSALMNARPSLRSGALPPNMALQRTWRNVTRFACANPTPTRQAAEPGCWTVLSVRGSV